MKEYIEREAVLTLVEPDARPFLAERIKQLPAADVRPVVRGKWEPVVAANEDGSPYQAGIRCSECCHFDVWEFNFCPNCGANMEES